MDPGITRLGQILVVVPAHNEENSLSGVVNAAKDVGCRVVVVDDASEDNTGSIARRDGAMLIPLANRLGAWGATQAGLRFALARNTAIVVTLDADGQHEPAHIHELTAPLLAGAADVVIGSCPVRVSRLRRWAWHYFRWLTGLTVRDLTSGFRAYNLHAIEVLSSADATLLDYQDVGVLMLMRAEGLRVQEVPVPINSRRNGISRVFPSWWVVTRYMMETTVLCLSHFSEPVSPRRGVLSSLATRQTPRGS